MSSVSDSVSDAETVDKDCRDLLNKVDATVAKLVAIEIKTVDKNGCEQKSEQKVVAKRAGRNAEDQRGARKAGERRPVAANPGGAFLTKEGGAPEGAKGHGNATSPKTAAKQQPTTTTTVITGRVHIQGKIRCTCNTSPVKEADEQEGPCEICSVSPAKEKSKQEEILPIETDQVKDEDKDEQQIDAAEQLPDEEESSQKEGHGLKNERVAAVELPTEGSIEKSKQEKALHEAASENPPRDIKAHEGTSDGEDNNSKWSEKKLADELDEDDTSTWYKAQQGLQGIEDLKQPEKQEEPAKKSAAKYASMTKEVDTNLEQSPTLVPEQKPEDEKAQGESDLERPLHGKSKHDGMKKEVDTNSAEKIPRHSESALRALKSDHSKAKSQSQEQEELSNKSVRKYASMTSEVDTNLEQYLPVVPEHKQKAEGESDLELPLHGKSKNDRMTKEVGTNRAQKIPRHSESAHQASLKNDLPGDGQKALMNSEAKPNMIEESWRVTISNQPKDGSRRAKSEIKPPPSKKAAELEPPPSKTVVEVEPTPSKAEEGAMPNPAKTNEDEAKPTLSKNVDEAKKPPSVKEDEAKPTKSEKSKKKEETKTTSSKEEMKETSEVLEKLGADEQKIVSDLDSLKTVTSKIHVAFEELRALHLLRQGMEKTTQKPGQPRHVKNTISIENERNCLAEIETMVFKICSKFK